jgi:PhzF family phenazine biosynthesis protein
MPLQKSVEHPEIYKARSFAAEGCRGNPAGVCLLDNPPDDDYQSRTAIKVGASETAFVVLSGEILPLRWFTAGGAEVDLCGHATLAAAGILWSKGFIPVSEAIRFNTRSGILKAIKDGEDIILDFPREKITEAKGRPRDFQKMLGFKPLFTARTSTDYFLVAEDEDVIKNIQPDFATLKKVTTRGIIVTACSGHKEYDFVSRFFAPAIGINEDPVTGSAHCALGPYWGGILKKDKLTGRQVSKEGGVVRVTVLKERVLLGGRIAED